MNNNNKSKRKEFIDMLIQILKEQFVNINPNREKISQYLDDRYVKTYFTNM